MCLTFNVEWRRMRVSQMSPYEIFYRKFLPGFGCRIFGSRASRAPIKFNCLDYKIIFSFRMHKSHTRTRELDYKIRINCGGCQKIEFLQITWNLFYFKRVPGAVDWCHLFLVFLQNCLRKVIKRYRANTGENYDKLRPIYEQICCINDRPILLPDANNFTHYNS